VAAEAKESDPGRFVEEAVSDMAKRKKLTEVTPKKESETGVQAPTPPTLPSSAPDTGGPAAATASLAPIAPIAVQNALRLEWRSPAELAENPRNWRRHPDAQLAALSDVIGEVGWAGACLFNERTGRLIDGHARRKVAMKNGVEKVPLLVVDVDEATEAKILATLDPLSAMARADKAAIDALLADVTTQSEPLNKMLEELAKAAGPAFAPNLAPETSQTPVTAADVAKEQAELAGQFAGGQKLTQVTCPQCACDFYIDPAQVAAEAEKKGK